MTRASRITKQFLRSFLAVNSNSSFRVPHDARLANVLLLSYIKIRGKSYGWTQKETVAG